MKFNKMFLECYIEIKFENKRKEFLWQKEIIRSVRIP